ncbi:hypothetical protein M413DRAFT_285755 [Hebeloma cylindrosporum]|uniref:F-box domain-containing protein n=1 Tax=Hebeloma cylindrosporum TaxID=76867 RepID=A0A0C2Y6H1_HEBCY|nr:hypothetical protein M413DRAFT_285755 [Hebeloma cylindrosporum h7]
MQQTRVLASTKSGVPAVVNCSRPSQSTCVQPVAPSSIGICELPVELLTTILEHLDWKDVLRIRKVRIDATLWNICPIFDLLRYARLFKKFLKHGACG